AHVDSFIDEVRNETLAAPAQTFERVSDEEEAESSRGKRSATKRSASKKGKKASVSVETEKPVRAAKKSAKKPAEKKSPSKKSASKGRKRAQATVESEATEDAIANADAMNEETARNAEEVYEDGEASLTTARTRAEFATRRGGRRRRRPSGVKRQESGNGEADRSNGKDETETEVLDADESKVAAPAQASHENGRRERSNRGDRSDRSDRGDRSDRAERGGDRSSSRSGGRHQQPTITDLLREGQEVLVQIAKEPIAKKGARITSHIALPGRYLVYMPTVEHVGVSRKIESDQERARLRKLIQTIRATETVPSGGFIVRTAGTGVTEDDLRDDARYLVRTWLDIRRSAERAKAPALVHQDLDLVERILRDQLSDEFAAIRVDSEEEYLRIVEFVNRIQPRMVKRVKLYTRDTPILEAFGVQAEIEKAIKPRVWLKSGGYLVINQTEALVAIDVNTGKFVGRGGSRLEDTITKTNLEAVEEIVRQIRLRDLGGIIVLDLIDMEERRNRQRVMQALHEVLQHDKSPTKVLSFNDFGLVIMTRKRVKQSLERTLCAPCHYCQGAGLVKSPQTICYEILEEARRLARNINGDTKQTTLRINPEVARALRGTERDVLNEIEDYLGAVDITSDPQIHQEQFDFAFI
ncbi:MAG TPA: Rne/Rng family ribonuclease, partial [Pyrinomonadaceae bacterium]|nr:Rne/Rng family ribonuclease [Pyrinomonadaceae bacterium]